MNKEPLIINCCLTGNVPTKKEAPYVPLSPSEIIKDAAGVIKAGTTYLHIHARDSRGVPTYKSEVFEKIISGIKKINDKVVICVTTSGRIFRNFDQRTEVLSLEEKVKPDFASFTLGSFNFPKEECSNSPEFIRRLATLLEKKKIRPEWEIFEPGMLHFGKYLVDKKKTSEPKWINIFLGSLGTSPLEPEVVSLFLSLLKPGWRFALVGVGRYQLKANMMSLTLGGHVRVGLEDSFFMDSEKRIPSTNVALVKRIVSVARAMGREIADTNMTRKLLLS